MKWLIKPAVGKLLFGGERRPGAALLATAVLLLVAVVQPQVVDKLCGSLSNRPLLNLPGTPAKGLFQLP
jgi:hypothetical protein